MKVFISYTTADLAAFKIPEIADFLEKKDDIERVYFWDRDCDTHESIDYTIKVTVIESTLIPSVISPAIILVVITIAVIIGFFILYYVVKRILRKKRFF